MNFNSFMPISEIDLKSSPLWNHLKGVISTIADEKPENLLEQWTMYELFTRTGHYYPPDDNQKEKEYPLPYRQAITSKEMSCNNGWANQCYQLSCLLTDIEKDSEEDKKTNLSNIVNEQEMFNLFGEGLSVEEAQLLLFSMKFLAVKEQLAELKFWGKIYGTQSDYYIMEGKVDPDREVESNTEDTETVQEHSASKGIIKTLNKYKVRNIPEAKAEVSSGTNEFTYYVFHSNNFIQWEKLSDVQPAQIIAARKISYHFTGSLGATLNSPVVFPGTEREYLRCQICRITHATRIEPKYTHFIAENEENEDTAKNKNYSIEAYSELPEMQPTIAPDLDDKETIDKIRPWFEGYCCNELLELSNWVHSLPQLLKQGRVTVYSVDKDGNSDTETDEGMQSTLFNKELIHPLLSDIKLDNIENQSSQCTIPYPAWALRKAFSCCTNNEQYYMARSIQWPGAYTLALCKKAASGAQTYFVYIGYGVKDGELSPSPFPPRMSTEFYSNAKLYIDATQDDELYFDPPQKLQVIEEEENIQNE